jgi:UPF0755 protein
VKNVWQSVAAVVGVIVLVVAAFGAGIGWLVYGDTQNPATDVDVLIASGSGVSQIASQLQSQGVIGNATLLDWYFKVRGGGDRIEAAEYQFPAHQTIAQVADRLETGGRSPTVWITIPEGFTAMQIAQRLGAAGLVPPVLFMREAQSRNLDIGGATTRGLEGFLFPDTYQVPRGADADEVIDMMTKQFEAELPPDYLAAARRLRRTVPEVVTIASMIEREAKVNSERPLIASVIYNRLRIGMPLEIDATIEYALPQHKAALSYADLAIDSPYNTYKHAGLPPTPISNPGKASLYAAFHPASTPFLYYVYKGGGHHAFSTTLQGQQQNERRYLR